MSLIKRLAGETVIYGLSSVLGRALGLLLLPLYTAVFNEREFGINVELYAWAAVLYVFFLLRFDTAFFRFGSRDAKSSFNTAFTSVSLFAAIIGFLLFFLAPYIGSWMLLEERYFYLLRLLAGILFFDALSEIPFAYLRLQNKALRFATIKIINICTNLFFNFSFLLFIPALLEKGYLTKIFSWYDPAIGLGFIFISNLIASILAFVLLLPDWRRVRLKIDKNLLSQMWKYAFPLVIVSIAGIVNELLDRMLLKRLLPYDLAKNEYLLGVYGAAYKFSIFIALFTQAFRYAAEPFFFKNADNKNAPDIYGQVGKYFVIAGSIGFLVILLYMDYFKIILRQPGFHEGLGVVPILLLANIFLGLYYNLSVWYKLTDRTRYAMYIALGGSTITILLNLLWIPKYGYWGSAWATFICYGAMTLASYLIGKRFYPLKHDLLRILGYMLFAVILWKSATYFSDYLDLPAFLRNIFFLLVIVLYIFFAYRVERKELRHWLGVK